MPLVWMGGMEMMEVTRVISIRRTAAAEAEASQERFLALASTGLDRAYRLAGLILGDSTEAQDATQDALVSAWRSRNSLKDPAVFEGWFDRILVNACRDRLRRRRKIAFISLDPDDHDRASPDPFARILDRDRVLKGLSVLTAEQRAVVALHYWSDLPLTEVAKRLDWPVGTVKTRLHAALERMRSEIGEESEMSRKAGRE